MATSLQSAGDSVFASSSAAPSGTISRKARVRKPEPWRLEEMSTPSVVKALVGYIDKMSASTERAHDAAAVALMPQVAQSADVVAKLLAEIEDQTCDRAFELSARDCIKELAKRLRKGAHHA